ncbi:MAG TPA: pyridoxal-dependent decarboxylase, partial [Candidatus Saccharimonadales bacterium]|nr:pyridoxal-dependent decarboxylase [Candidatus Saccharimonadales bacterium]
MQSDLDLTPEEIESAAAGITRMLAAFRAGRETAPVLAGPRGAEIAEALGGPLPREGTSLESLLDEVRRKVIPTCRRNDSPRFFGYVCSGGSDVGTLADYLASGLNQNVTAWRSAPSATELERIVIEWIGQIVGMPAGSAGLLLGGGTAATLTAL